MDNLFCLTIFDKNYKLLITKKRGVKMITAVNKKHILDYLKEHSIDDLYYDQLREFIARARNKVTDIEVLYFLIDLIITKFQSNEKGVLKLIAKSLATIDSFITWISEDEVVIDENYLDKIRCFREYYNEFLSNTKSAGDKDVDMYIDKLSERMKNEFTKEEKSDEITGKEVVIKKYLDEINKLTDEIVQLKKDLAQKESTIGLLQSKYEKKQENLCAINEELQAKTLQLKTIQDAMNELLGEFEKLTLTNSKLEKINGKFNNMVVDFETLKKELEEKEKIILELQKAKEKELLIKKKAEETKNRENDISYIILQSLCEGPCSINELNYLLQEKGYLCEKEEIYKILMDLSKRFNIVNTAFNGVEPKYRIARPNITINGKLNIDVPVDQKCYDILLVSDLHISSFKDTVNESLTMIGQYCKDNKIQLVLNLGDLFHFNWSSRAEVVKNFTGCERLVKKTISKYPYVEGIYNAVMGGNHDSYANRYGIDPIKNVADAREDFIYLGYDHAIVTFNGCSSIVLHHPNNHFSEPVGKEICDTSDIVSYVDSYYKEYGRNREETYIDILGHFHKAYIDTINSLCIMPSYNYDRQLQGAYHMKVYFNEERKISNLVFMPLIKSQEEIKSKDSEEIEIKKELKPVIEIAYEKKLVR